MRLLLLPFILITFTYHSYSQTKVIDSLSLVIPYKFDSISKEEMLLDLPTKYSDANAMILNDFGFIRYSSNGTTFERKTKIKIFKKSGFKWGDFRIPFIEIKKDNPQNDSLIIYKSQRL